jgi:hypothetical protein
MNQKEKALIHKLREMQCNDYGKNDFEIGRTIIDYGSAEFLCRMLETAHANGYLEAIRCGLTNNNKHPVK